MDGYFGDKKWYSNNYSESLDNIEKILLNNIDETKKLVHYFNKIALDLKSHIEGWEIIYIRDNYSPEFKEVSLKKAILNQLASFAEEFNELRIKIKFSEHFSEESSVTLDKKLFCLVMYNFFSNVLKYSMPNEEIRFNYDEQTKNLDISMYSTKIEKEEMEQIFQDGVRGLNANNVSSSGNGLGLFVIKRALELMGFKNMYISPQYAKTKLFDEVTFIENHFRFEFKAND